MKTEDFIAMLASDTRAPVKPIGRRIGLALLAGAFLSAAVFMAALGPRPDVMSAMHTVRFDLKFVDTVALLAPSFLLCVRLSRPDASAGVMLAWLLAPLALLFVAVLIELAVTPPELWAVRMVGTNRLHCLTLIPLLSIPPLGALIAALREGAPARPMLTGALAGAAAAGVAATIYATNCTDDSPLFVASWYPISTAIVVIAGAFAGRRWLQW